VVASRRAGGISYVPVGDEVRRAFTRTLSIPHRSSRRVGDFRLTSYLSRVKGEITTRLANAAQATEQDATQYIKGISPVYSGAYKEAVKVDADFTRGTEAGQLSLLVASVPGIDYAEYVEYGGGHTPAHAVLRRGMDYAQQVLRTKLAKASTA